MNTQITPDDIRRWRTAVATRDFDVETYIRQGEYSQPIVSPARFIAHCELQRYFERGLRVSPDYIGTDLFLMSAIESDRGPYTKIGGTPFRPLGKSWPLARDGFFEGQPMTLLAQFSFAESRDLLPPLPGDVMLVFVSDPNAISDETYPNSLVAEWYKSGEVTDPIRSCDVPPPLFPAPRFTCHRARCNELAPSMVPHVASAAQRFFPDCSVDEAEVPVRQFCFYYGMKIGGSPVWPYLDMPEAWATQKFLCSFSSVYTDVGEVFPWVNREEPYETLSEVCADDVSYNIRDGFVLNFFLAADQSLSWHMGYL